MNNVIFFPDGESCGGAKRAAANRYGMPTLLMSPSRVKQAARV